MSVTSNQTCRLQAASYLLVMFNSTTRCAINSTKEQRVNQSKQNLHSLCDFDRASSLICGNKMPTRCNRGFYCRSYCLLNMSRASLCPSSGAQEYYTVVAVCGISCCKNVKNDFVSFCGICVLSLKCRVLSRFVTRCVEYRGGIVMPETC